MPKPVSGYRFRVRVLMNDGTELDVTSKLTDVLRWEKDNGRGWLEIPLPLDRQLWVIWAAAKRLGLVEGIDQPGWAAQVDDFELIDFEDEKDGEQPDPTQPAP